MPRDFGTYRKLYENPPPSFERLPFRFRSMAAELLRRCDRLGRIVPTRSDDHDLVKLSADLAFHVRSTGREDDEYVAAGLRCLLEDGYLVIDDNYLKIRNFVEAQRSDSRDRMRRHRDRVTSRDAGDVTSVTSSRLVSSRLEDQEGNVRPRMDSFAAALEVPIETRCQYARQNPHMVQFLEPHRWPEVAAVADAMAKATGRRTPRLGATRDHGVEAVVALYADGWSQEELVRAVTVVAASDWWQQGKRGLSSLTPEVVRRALADAPGELSQADREDLERFKRRRQCGK